MTEVELVYPAPCLSPNARAHFRTRHAAAKKHRAWAAAATRAARPVVPDSGPIPILLTFYPATKRRRDADNALASLKPALDGIADALRVNDSRFDPRVRFAEPAARPRVVATFE